MTIQPTQSLAFTLGFVIALSLYTDREAYSQEAKSNPSTVQLKPLVLTDTFYIRGIQTESQVKAILARLREVPNVTNAEGLEKTNGMVNVTFDRHATSFHHIALAIIDAAGSDVEVSSYFFVPEAHINDHLARLTEVFEKYADLVSVRLVDLELGLFKLSYRKIALDPSGGPRQGFRLGVLYHAIHDTPPRGLGLIYIPLEITARSPTATVAAPKK